MRTLFFTAAACLLLSLSAKAQDSLNTQANLPMLFETKEIDIMPRFPGCEHLNISDELKKQCADRKMMEFIFSKIEYPRTARKKGVEGIVVVSFVVEKNGTITDIVMVRDIGAGCGEEALRVVKLMEKEKIKWSPGIKDNKPVRVQFNLPVKFKLT